MKKSILLIVPLTFLVSCSGTSEIYDDAYNAKVASVVTMDEETAYADYIQIQENFYTVEVDSSTKKRSMNGLNPAYYGNEAYYGAKNLNNFDDLNSSVVYYQGLGYGYPQYNNARCGANYYNHWDICQYSCQTFYRSGNCWHVRNNQMNLAGTYSPYGSYGWGNLHSNVNYFYTYSYGYNSYNNYSYFQCGNSYAFGIGYGYPYWGGLYYGGCNNYFPYYSYGYPYWGGSYYGGYNTYFPYYGYGGWAHYGNNLTNNSGQNNEVYSSNHHYGHRGGSSSGSHSQNNTAYEHSVKQAGQNTTPFPAYPSGQTATTETNHVMAAKPSNSTFSGSIVGAKPSGAMSSGNQLRSSDKPFAINTGTMSNQSESLGNSKPPVNENNTTLIDHNVDKPVTSRSTKYIAKHLPANNQFTAKSSGTRAVNKGSRTGGSSSTTTYIDPDKDGNQNTGSGHSTTATSMTNNSGKKSNNRRTYSNGYGGSTNSSGSGRSSGSMNSKSRSGSSPGSSSRSSSSGLGSSGSGGSSSRRR